ncbi:MAG: hypothetical protein IPJ67_02570 [Candidatus Moraniibacteriota bacterium]|nr:MAG: hypothetical protein IPJ67_02570 [Candidatus Moranbacteria bacterium]
MQDEHQEEDYQEEEGGFKVWLEDNLRIILSILVVFAIAGGIYSYSQRSQTPALTEETTTTSDEADQATKPDDQIAEGETKAAPEVKKDDSTTKPDTTKVAEVKPTETTPEPTMTESKETETTFVETAARGDSATLLARQAVANFLEKNPDSAISREHKVYIEDYLRKHTVSGPIHVGTSIEFSKSLIQEAIGKSKQLNDRQLTNLKKYSSRAPSLR